MALHFQSAGRLWREASVLQDVETGSLWSQVTGECISGVLEGKALTPYPSAMTTAAEFHRQYPGGKLLTKEQPGPDRSPYSWYADDSATLSMFGRVDDFERLPGKEIVYGLRWQGKQVAISKNRLSQRQLVMLEQFTPPLIVTSDSSGQSVAAFLSPVDRQHRRALRLFEDTLAFDGNGGRWNARTGRSVSEGGSDLTAVPITTAYWFAWVSFFPETELVK